VVARTPADARVDPRPGDTRQPAPVYYQPVVTKYTVVARPTAAVVRVQTEWSDGYVMDPFDYPVRLWSEGLCTWTPAP